jgi:hypothetical protein
MTMPGSDVVPEPPEDQAPRIVRLFEFLRDHPGMTLARMKCSTDLEIMKLASLAERMARDGHLCTNPKIGLVFTDSGLAMYEQALQDLGTSPVEAALISVRILDDVQEFGGQGGRRYKLNKGDVSTLPGHIARALIERGKAEGVQDAVRKPEDVPTVMQAPSLGVEKREMAPIIPERLRDPRIKFVRVRRVGEIKPDGQPANGKEAMGEGWNNWENAYLYDSITLAGHISDGGNYGVLCGHGLIVIDADYPEVAAAVDVGLPETFTVKSGRDGAGGFHYYYWCGDLPNPIRLEVRGAKKGEGGDVQSTGKQVIGPGSTHRTGRKYHVIKDLPIAEITAHQLRGALQDFMPLPEMDTTEDLKRQAPEGGDDLDQLRVEKVIPLDGLTSHGHRYQGSCPWHSSDTGSNFTVDLDKNVWHCFRHSTGGGPLQAIAVQEGIIECGESVRGGLTGQRFKDVLKVAEEKYGLVRTPRVQKDKKNGSRHGFVDSLIRYARQGGRAEFFHNSANIPFARVEVCGHHEVRAIGEQDFTDWIKYQAVKTTGRAPKKDPLNQAIDTVSVIARFEGEEREVYIRKGEHDGVFYYDLCNNQWQAVRITAEGWEIVDDPPVMFRRFDKMRPQVAPIGGHPEKLDDLLSLINTSNESRKQLKSHMVTSLVPHILEYNAFFLGPQGSTKSTGTDIFKAFIDPGTDNRDSLPPRVDDLDLHLSKRCVASYDNISKITAELSDTLTRASRGSSSRRRLFTDNDENSRSYSAQIVLNAIGLESGVRPDLLDRTIIYICEVVEESKRLGQEEVDRRIEELMPYAFGAALDILVKAIPVHDELKKRKGWSPRLKDSYLWMMAATKAMGKNTAAEEGEFETAFRSFIERRDSDAMEGDPLAVAVEHVAKQYGFVGTATQLHEWINDFQRNIPELCHIDTKDKGWPKSGIALGIHLPRIIAPLRSRGVYVYQAYRFELEKTFDVATLRTLDRPKADLTSFRDQERMIIISPREAKKIEPTTPGGR